MAPSCRGNDKQITKSQPLHHRRFEEGGPAELVTSVIVLAVLHTAMARLRLLIRVVDLGKLLAVLMVFNTFTAIPYVHSALLPYKSGVLRDECNGDHGCALL